ncbi:hypothetical protein FKP32DRAFT_1606088 [Trametes sanguinea]|nr:hypothetical protein FKP32DRAFT_1606088 [Trametes sanguinea]
MKWCAGGSPEQLVEALPSLPSAQVCSRTKSRASSSAIRPATDRDGKIPYSTSDFKNLPNNTWFFYRTADDLFNLNITNGQRRNDSVPQNVTFGEQGGVLGTGSNGASGLAIGSVQWRCRLP